MNATARPTASTTPIWSALVVAVLLLTAAVPLLPDAHASHQPNPCRAKRFARPLERSARVPVLVTIYNWGEMCILRIDPRTRAMQRLVRTDGQGHMNHPTYSPDKRLIAFERRVYRDPAPTTVDLYVMNADGTGQVAVAMNTSEFDWSPASNELVFRSSDPNDIFIASADGTIVRRLPPYPLEDPGERSCPRWSPQGNEISYHRLQDWYTTDVYAMDLLTATERHVIGGDVSEGVAEWSHDGTKIAFVRVVRTDTEAINDLFVTDASGGDRVGVTKQPGRTDRLFAWSPDDSMIAYTAYPNPMAPGKAAQLWVAAADGSWRRRLKFLEPGADQLTWSPNSRRILFIKDRNLWSIRVDGTRQRRLTDLSDFPAARALSPSWGSSLSCYATGL